MNVERIQVRKIYFSSAVYFGLVFGLFLGFLTFVILSILEYTGYSLASTAQVGGYAFAALGGLVYFVLFFLVTLLMCALYNLSVKLGGRIDLGLAEHVAKAPKAKKEKAPAASDKQIQY